MELLIRKAEIADLEALLDIYNYEVVNGVATLDIVPRTYEQRKEWFCNHNIENHPLYTALADGVVAGYASLSKYRDKEAYNSTAELSVYIHKDYRGKGIAGALMERILEYARNEETLHTIVSVITSGNEASVRMNKKFGFEYCGTIKRVAVKFGKFIDIDNYRISV